MIEDVFARRFEGEDPRRVESLWRRVHGSGFSLRPDPSLMGVMSGLEMACWDIAGKAADQPVYDLLGGRVRERLRSYTYIYPAEGESEAIYHDAERSAERALEYVAQGFTAIKFDPAGAYSAFDPRQPRPADHSSCPSASSSAIREAVGTQGRPAVRHARPVHHIRRDPPRPPARAL